MKALVQLRTAALAVLVGTATVACDSLPSGPESNRQSRVVLSGSTAAALSQSVAMSLSGSDLDAASLDRGGNGPGKGGRNGPIDLSTVDKVEVQITSIQVAVTPEVAQESDDAEAESRGGWVELPLVYDPEDTWFDLTDLGAVELATVPVELAGPIAAIRLHFGEAWVLFNDGTEESLRIPSGKVTLAASNVTVNEGTDVVIRFDSGASVGKIIRTGNGLLMPPVFRVANGDGRRGGTRPGA